MAGGALSATFAAVSVRSPFGFTEFSVAFLAHVTSMTKPQRFCIFCNRPGLSKEHVFSQWMHAYLPTDVSEYRHQVSRRFDPVTGMTKTEKAQQGSVAKLQLRIVCEFHCNNGWISRLDEAIKPILTPLILGQPATLDVVQQRMLATWVAAKFMTAEFSYPDDIVTPFAEREFLRVNQEPPSNWRIWISRCRAERWKTKIDRMAVNIGKLDHQPPPIPSGQKYVSKNTQHFTVGIGELFVNAISNTNGLNLIRKDRIETWGHFIWPAEKHLFWPSGPILIGERADACNSLLLQIMNFDRSNWFPVARE